MNNAELAPADITARQLGGLGCLKVMIGLKSAYKTDEGRTLVLSFPSPHRGPNVVRITLDASDTYTVVFMTVRGANVKVGPKFDMIYAEQLIGSLEAHTGLAWRLF